MLLEKSVDLFTNVIMKEHNGDELCDMETFKAMIRDLDESWSADTLKKTKLIAKSKGSHLGGTGRVEVAEVYIPPRMTEMVRQLGMEGNVAMELITTDENGEPWDLRKQKMQEKAIRFLNETKPAVLILSPPCTMFSAMQNINIHKMKRGSTTARVQEAVAHFAFAVLLCLRRAQRC